MLRGRGFEDTARVVESVGKGGVTRDDGDGDGLGQAEAGGGVDDVGVTHAVDLDELLSVARGGNGRIGKDERKRCAGGCAERGDLDGPTGFAGRRIAEGEIATGGDHRAGETALREEGEGFVGGVAFGDAAEVEQHAGAEQGDGARGGIEAEVNEAGGVLGGGAGFGAR